MTKQAQPVRPHVLQHEGMSCLRGATPHSGKFKVLQATFVGQTGREQQEALAAASGCVSGRRSDYGCVLWWATTAAGQYEDQGKIGNAGLPQKAANSPVHPKVPRAPLRVQVCQELWG